MNGRRLNLITRLNRVLLSFKRIRVYALVGKSGTGKSFRAQLQAQKRGVGLIIDDGLLIRGQKILGGRSAKKDQRRFTAIKTALFQDPAHAAEARKIIGEGKFKRILIIGTSQRMVWRICENLNLPYPRRTTSIEEIATETEIEAAVHSRAVSGKHIIPVPAIELKRGYSRILLDAVEIFFRHPFSWKKRKNSFQKAVVRPRFSKRGRVTISRAALGQMVIHCVNEYDPRLKVERLVIDPAPSGYRLEVVLEVPFQYRISGHAHELQLYVMENLERYAGLDLQEVNVTVGSVAPPPREEPAAAADE